MRALLVFLLFLFSCTSHQKTLKKPLVLTSLPPYQYFVESIAGGVVEAQSVVPQGADSHSYEPTPKQRTLLNQGCLWFQIGEGFESSLACLSKRVVKINLRTGLEHHEDRHYWLSPRIAMHQVSLITKTLCDRFPEHRALFLQNSEKLLEELSALHASLETSLAHTKKRVLIASHPSFYHFCHDYSFEQYSVEQDGKDLRPKHFEALIQQAREQQDCLVLIAQPQHNSKGLQVIARELHLPVHELDPYAYDYFQMMHTLADVMTHDCD